MLPFAPNTCVIASYSAKSVTEASPVSIVTGRRLSFWYVARNTGSPIQTSPTIVSEGYSAFNAAAQSVVNFCSTYEYVSSRIPSSPVLSIHQSVFSMRYRLTNEFRWFRSGILSANHPCVVFVRTSESACMSASSIFWWASLWWLATEPFSQSADGRSFIHGWLIPM